MPNTLLRLTCFVATLGRGPPARLCAEIAAANVDTPPIAATEARLRVTVPVRER